jgi:hypothetical protein
MQRGAGRDRRAAILYAHMPVTPPLTPNELELYRRLVTTNRGVKMYLRVSVEVSMAFIRYAVMRLTPPITRHVEVSL